MSVAHCPDPDTDGSYATREHMAEITVNGAMEAMLSPPPPPQSVVFSTSSKKPEQNVDRSLPQPMFRLYPSAGGRYANRKHMGGTRVDNVVDTMPPPPSSGASSATSSTLVVTAEAKV